MRDHKFWQYPRGDNMGGVLDVQNCPTISSSSWEQNCFLIEYEYGDICSKTSSEELRQT